ncbi:TonB-dependent siderophore receptor [soil metagenome]
MLPIRAAYLLAIVCAAGTAAAQTGNISGQVEDEHGVPLQGAHILLPDLDRGATSDSDGHFRIVGVPTGDHRIRASFVGFVAVEQRVDVREAAESVVVFRLAEDLLSLHSPIGVTADRLVTVGRTGAPIRLVPQSVSRLDEGQLRSQGAVNVETALRNVAGVSTERREQPFATLTLRGLPSDGTGSFRRNGIEIAHYSDGLRPNVVAVEVLKGPASVLYGRLEPGGVVNFVTRQPIWIERSQAEAEVEAGAFGSVGVRGMAAPLISETVAVVFDGSFSRRGSFRDQVEQSGVFVSGASRARLSSSTWVTVDAEFDTVEASLDPGLAMVGGLDVVERSTFFGEPDARYTWRSGFASATMIHRIDRGTLGSVTARAAYGDYHHRRDLVQLDSLTTGGRVARSFSSDLTDYRYVYGEVSADGVWSGETVRHTYAVGVEATRLAIGVTGNAPLRRVDGQWRFAAIEPISLSNPQPTGLPPSDELVEYVAADGSGLNLGLFAQNRTTIVLANGNIHYLMSGRLSHVRAGAEWFALAATAETPSGLNERSVALTAVTPSIGLLYEDDSGWSVYGSYGTSFNPIFQQVDQDGEPFEPTRGRQLEAGAKFTSNGWTATLAAFNIEKRGALSVAPSGFYVQTGAQRSRGLELEVQGEWGSRLRLQGAATLLNAMVTADDVVPVGNRLPGAPPFMGRVWGQYDVISSSAATLQISLGSQYVGERYGTLANHLLLPSYLLVDGGLALRLRGGVGVRLLGENLLDQRYLIAAERCGPEGVPAAEIIAGWPGAPRTIRLSVGYRFR